MFKRFRLSSNRFDFPFPQPCWLWIRSSSSAVECQFDPLVGSSASWASSLASRLRIRSSGLKFILHPGADLSNSCVSHQKPFVLKIVILTWLFYGTLFLYALGVDVPATLFEYVFAEAGLAAGGAPTLGTSRSTT